jgi:hypothetical protein
MRKTPFNLLGVAVVALWGCSHSTSPGRLGERTKFSWYGLRNDTTNSIPLPHQTPYDDDAGARAVYLQAYWEGYRFATENPGLIVDSYHPQGPYAVPKEEGYSRGGADANRTAMKRRMDEEMRQAEDAMKRLREQREKDRSTK